MAKKEDPEETRVNAPWKEDKRNLKSEQKRFINEKRKGKDEKKGK